MFQNIINLLTQWNNTTGERQKLQHAYLLISVIGIIVAGLVSLIDADTGSKLTYVAFAAIVTFLINALAWNLLSSLVLSKLPVRAKRK